MSVKNPRKDGSQIFVVVRNNWSIFHRLLWKKRFKIIEAEILENKVNPDPESDYYLTKGEERKIGFAHNRRMFDTEGDALDYIDLLNGKITIKF